jgi:hypothetical protein
MEYNVIHAGNEFNKGNKYRRPPGPSSEQQREVFQITAVTKEPSKYLTLK